MRIRIGNLSPMDHHPIHLHGYQFTVTESDGGRYPKSAQHPDTTVLVPVGSTRTVEFVADEPGDWAMHCHMTHHVMNQMGHGFPNMIGVKAGKLDERARKNLRLPGYMTMGQSGMADMGDMGMPVPPNSIPMVGGQGPLDYITMGGMFTILKVRESLPSGYEQDPGWYREPPGTLAAIAAADVLAHNSIAGDGSSAPQPPASVRRMAAQAPQGATGAPSEHAHRVAPTTAPTTTATDAVYTCPMHSDVVSLQPGRCPKCKMQLVLKN